MLRSQATIAWALIVLSTGPGEADDPPTREVWADTFVVESEELEGWVDTEYRFAHSEPTWQMDRGPTVCVDEWHFNRHTIRGIYWPFAELLRGDGYRVEPYRSIFGEAALTDCEILVIANPQALGNMFGPGAPDSNWAYPHGSALTAEETSELLSWVRRGGSLFLISDHAPLAAAASDLGLLLGVHMLDGYTFASEEEMTNGQVGEIVFGKVNALEWERAVHALRQVIDLDFETRYDLVLESPGTLGPHPVLDGRSAAEQVDWVITYTGQAFLVTEDWEPVLVLGPKAVSVIPWTFNLEDVEGLEGPRFESAGWLQGATRQLGRGRIALLGDGNTCSAALDDVDSELAEPLMPEGFNDPRAPHNAQFCLNIVHWLSGLLDDQAE